MPIGDIRGPKCRRRKSKGGGSKCKNLKKEGLVLRFPFWRRA